MECNKEEALNAKSIAEKKMQQKDFVGARKIVLKAQRLFPDIENIAQMLTVCDVHCAEAVKKNNQEDWYGILQVEPTADEHSIKKQYRKLALLLHPDKNKFVGAEAAFKLVGEAHRILSDRAKRAAYDCKRHTSGGFSATIPPHQRASPSPYASGHSGVPKQQPQQSQDTFWTFCPFCGIRYQYYRSTMSRAVRCQTCSKSFIAYDMNARNVPTQAHSTYSAKQSGVPQNNGFTHANTFKTTQASPNINFQGSTAPGPWSKSRTNKEFGGTSGNTADQGNNSNIDPGKEREVTFEKVKLEKVTSKTQTTKSSGNTGRKRVRETVENISEEECSLSDSSDSDEEIDETKRSGWNNVDTGNSKNPRRSTRQKQNVTYTEDQSDDDFVRPPKKSRNGRSSRQTVLSDDDIEEVKMSTEAFNCKENVEGDLSSGGSQVNHKSDPVEKDDELDDAEETSDATQPDEGGFTYPDPEFHDFDKDREAGVFKPGQIWALYDDLDGMPRFYVKIYTVFESDFKIRFCWLEHAPRNEAENRWSEAGLPIGCGSFRIGEKETSDNRAMFSHLMSCEKDKRKHRFNVGPENCQIWALYRGWDASWPSTHENRKCFDYEIVEIISVGEKGVNVARLTKVIGFVSLFARGSPDSLFNIPCNDMMRFSHMIPSYRMTGKEVDGVPEGFYELDPASLPPDFETKFPSLSIEDIKHSCLGKETSLKSKVPGLDISENHQSRNTHVYPEGSRDHMENQIPNPECGTSSNMEKSNFTAKEEKLNCSNTKANEGIENSNDSLAASVGEDRHTQFYDFEADKSFTKITKGQIWALHCNRDGFPKDYVFVRDVQERVSKVHITRLEVLQDFGCQRDWYEKKIPTAFGRFKLSSGKGSREVLDTLASFSHIVKYEPCPTKNQYDIYPHVGQVWALFRNWSPDWVGSDIKSCLEYDVVEVLSVNISIIIVLLLEKKSHSNSKTLFAPKVTSSKPSILEIPSTEILRFSHRIPSFRLPGETGEHLGLWELDPASLPGTSHPHGA